MIRINNAEELATFVNDYYCANKVIKIMGEEVEFGQIKIDPESFIATSITYPNIIFLIGNEMPLNSTCILGVIKGYGTIKEVWGAEIPSEMAEELMHKLASSEI